MKIMDYRRLHAPFMLVTGVISIIILLVLIPHVSGSKIPEMIALSLLLIISGFFMMPMPKTHMYFEFSSPIIILSILILGKLASIPYVVSDLLAGLYKSKTTRRSPFYVIFWNTLRLVPVIWISSVVYQKLEGNNFQSLSELRLFPFIVMAFTYAIVELLISNTRAAAYLGKPPWQIVFPFGQVESIFIPLAIPMFIMYQSAGIKGLIILAFPWTLVLFFAKLYFDQFTRRQESLDALSIAGELIAAKLSFRELVERAVVKIEDIFKPQAVELFLKNSDGWKLDAHRGKSPWVAKEPSSVFLTEVTQLISKKPVLVADISGDQRFSPYQEAGLLSLLFIPLLTGEEVIGFVLSSHHISRYFHEEHLALSKILVGQLSNAVVGAQLHDRLARAHQELQETQAQLVQSEKMAGLGKLVAGVAHELNSPLNVFTLEIPVLQADVAKIRENAGSSQALAGILERMPDSLSRLEEAALRSRDIIVKLRTFANKETKGEEWDYVDVHETIDTTLSFLDPLCEGRIKLHREYGPIPKVWGNAPLLHQAFMNVVVNAFEAIEGTGEVRLSTFHSDGKVYLAVKDSGKGIPKPIQKRIFDPFFTTKDVGKGTGLGLSVAYGIVKRHRGEIRLESEEAARPFPFPCRCLNASTRLVGRCFQL